MYAVIMTQLGGNRKGVSLQYGLLYPARRFCKKFHWCYSGSYSNPRHACAARVTVLKLGSNLLCQGGKREEKEGKKEGVIVVSHCVCVAKNMQTVGEKVLSP